MLPQKSPYRQELSHNFIEIEKVKQNEKLEESVSNERIREKNPEKTTGDTEINNLLGKEFKALDKNAN